MNVFSAYLLSIIIIIIIVIIQEKIYVAFSPVNFKDTLQCQKVNVKKSCLRQCSRNVTNKTARTGMS